MDPVTLLVSTLALGASAALKDTAGDAVKDAYAGLKSIIVNKFGSQPAVDALEQKPESVKKREAAEEDLAAAAADTDVVQAADKLATVIQRDDPRVGDIVGISVDNVVAKFPEIEGVRSSGSGVLVRNTKLEGGRISIKNVVAGLENPDRP